MQRIRVSDVAVRTAIRNHCPSWREWAELKPLFLDWQQHRCGYCQGEIGGRVDPRTSDRDLYEQHVEHYRPQGRVRQWSPPSDWSGPPVFHVGSPAGYPWLAKDASNYLASCITCNSKYKHDHFPVAQPLKDYSHQPGPTEMKAENAYLINPFGDAEHHDPERLIAFWGCEALPHPQWPVGCSEYWRGMVTIELLGLNRVDLKTRRAKQIVTMGVYFSQFGHTALDDWCSSKAEFCSCACFYRDLCIRDRVAAIQVALQLAIELDWQQHSEILIAAGGTGGS